MKQGIEILLIEDNPDDAALAIRALRKQNLADKLLHLHDGAEALDFIFGKEEEIPLLTTSLKVILLDLKMPKVSGPEVLKKLKSDTRTRDIPVVILTSSAEDPDIKKCYELGANSYVVKPMEFEDFIKSVGNLGNYWMLFNNNTVNKRPL
jgi:two-component system, response regulator